MRHLEEIKLSFLVKLLNSNVKKVSCWNTLCLAYGIRYVSAYLVETKKVISYSAVL